MLIQELKTEVKMEIKIKALKFDADEKLVGFVEKKVARLSKFFDGVAQNTTPEQMKMFLTRMGVGSKVVVTGDVTQIDLPERTRSGLVDALHVLKNVNGIAQCYFTEKDVVRHRLVQEIIKAYEKAAHPEK